MGKLMPPRELKLLILNKIYAPCGINQQLLEELSPQNRQAVIDWTRLELMRKENICAENYHIEYALRETVS